MVPCARIKYSEIKAGRIMCIWLEFEQNREGSKALLDTGSAISIMPSEMFESIQQSQQLTEPDKKLKSANGQPIECFGKARVNFNVEGQKFSHEFYVCENDVNLIMGMDYMQANFVSIDMEPTQNRVRIQGRTEIGRASCRERV